MYDFMTREDNQETKVVTITNLVCYTSTGPVLPNYKILNYCKRDRSFEAHTILLRKLPEEIIKKKSNENYKSCMYMYVTLLMDLFRIPCKYHQSISKVYWSYHAQKIYNPNVQGQITKK